MLTQRTQRMQSASIATLEMSDYCAGGYYDSERNS
jgi:hypothetical protein